MNEGHGDQPNVITSSSTLDQFGPDLVALACQGRLPPVIGLSKEREWMLAVLASQGRNNLLVLGPNGVGKAAAVRGLAQAIAAGRVPTALGGSRIIALDLAGLKLHAADALQFKGRLCAVLNEAGWDPKTILWIADLPGFAWATEVSDLVKAIMARGIGRVICTGTQEAFTASLKGDPALGEQFQHVTLHPLAKPDAVAVLRGLRAFYEERHGVAITDAALEAAVDLGDRYLCGRCLPGKAVEVLDQAGARVAVRKEASDLGPGVVDPEMIAEIITGMIGVRPAPTDDGPARLLQLEGWLGERIVGQDEAIARVARRIRLNRVGLKDPHRPIGVFVFAGPAGVGKSQLAERLAEFLMGDKNALLRLAMGHYAEKYTLSRILGVPPNYAGYEEPGRLTAKVRRRPYSVVLFDEIEKAHPDVFLILLQILEEARLIDHCGRSVDFKNTLIIMTTTVGAEELHPSASFSPQCQPIPWEVRMEKAFEAVKNLFPPPFVSRLDDIIVFRSLTKANLEQIAGSR